MHNVVSLFDYHTIFIHHKTKFAKTRVSIYKVKQKLLILMLFRRKT